MSVALLVGQPRERAVAACHRIGRALQSRAQSPRPPTPWRTGQLALLYGHLAELWPDEYGALSDALFVRTCHELAEVDLAPQLCNGLAGVGWLYQKMAQPADVAEDQGAIIDEVLIALVRQGRCAEYDLVGGLVGIGMYGLARRWRPSGARLLELTLGQLLARAELTRHGATWRAPRRRRYDLGLAHGVAGVVALLGAALAAGQHDVRATLESAMQWLFAQRTAGGSGRGRRRDDNDVGEFPPVIDPERGSVASHSRGAWCYGDPGVALALHTAARALGHAEWQEQALAVARRAALRPVLGSGVVDAGLCHGSAGLMHLFDAFYRATGEIIFAQAARRWFEETWARVTQVTVRGGDDSFYTGATGIALALLSAAGAQEPTWSGLLLPQA